MIYDHFNNDSFCQFRVDHPGLVLRNYSFFHRSHSFCCWRVLIGSRTVHFVRGPSTETACVMFRSSLSPSRWWQIVQCYLRRYTAWLFCALVGDQGTWHVPEKTADVKVCLFALVATGLLIMLTIAGLSDSRAYELSFEGFGQKTLRPPLRDNYNVTSFNIVLQYLNVYIQSVNNGVGTPYTKQ